MPPTQLPSGTEHDASSGGGSKPGTPMKRLFYVDREMCGGDDLPPEFDLDDFCEELQGKLADVEVVPVSDPDAPSANRDHDLVRESVFLEALGEYLHR
ncbi:MAG: hypothetical protein RIS76_950 [Verrucomicrobiota bacterium]